MDVEQLSVYTQMEALDMASSCVYCFLSVGDEFILSLSSLLLLHHMLVVMLQVIPSFTVMAPVHLYQYADTTLGVTTFHNFKIEGHKKKEKTN